MIVMPANNGRWMVHYWQGKYGGLGHLYSPGRSFAPMSHLPYALDNGAFPAWKNGAEWDEAAFVSHLSLAVTLQQPPSWVVAPDVVADAEATMSQWPSWREEIEARGMTAALAVQDGMVPEAVRELDPEVIFVGGTTKWKWLWLERWCREFPRVHVGRVNTYKWLLRCHHAGAESCDGTGWFRGCQKQLAGLEQFLREQAAGTLPPDPCMFR